jgi:hypothetical protein
MIICFYPANLYRFQNKDLKETPPKDPIQVRANKDLVTKDPSSINSNRTPNVTQKNNPTTRPHHVAES